MTKKQEKRIEKWAFEAFAYAHPHEAYRSYPERFWKFCHRVNPYVSRNQMEQILKETSDEVEKK